MKKTTEQIISYIALMLIVINVLMINDNIKKHNEIIDAYSKIEQRMRRPLWNQTPTVQFYIQDKSKKTDPKLIYIVKKATIYGYSSTVDQTDGDPLTTASGEKVRDGIIGNNCLPFGTIVEFNGQKFTVTDRMNKRYGCDYFDRWFPSREAAKQWGKRVVSIKIYQ